jgi:hypothetical protein
MRTEGPDFLQRNSALAEELRRTFVDLDEIEKELRKASTAIQSVSAQVVRYRDRLRDLCETAMSTKKEPTTERDGVVRRVLGA